MNRTQRVVLVVFGLVLSLLSVGLMYPHLMDFYKFFSTYSIKNDVAAVFWFLFALGGLYSVIRIMIIQFRPSTPKAINNV